MFDSRNISLQTKTFIGRYLLWLEAISQCWNWTDILDWIWRRYHSYIRDKQRRQEYDWLCLQLLLVPMEMTWSLSLSGIKQQVTQWSQVAFLFVFNSSSLLPTPGPDITAITISQTSTQTGTSVTCCRHSVTLVDGTYSWLGGI